MEICTRLSADGVAVVRRLAYLDDDTDLIGPVHALAWAELATARVGPQERPLSRLSDVVAALDGGTDLEIQLKSTEPELVDAVLAALEGADQDRVQITSVHAAFLARAAAVNPEVIRCLLIDWLGPTPYTSGPTRSRPRFSRSSTAPPCRCTSGTPMTRARWTGWSGWA